MDSLSRSLLLTTPGTQPEAAEELLKRGAAVNAVNTDGWTALHFAAAASKIGWGRVATDGTQGSLQRAP